MTDMTAGVEFLIQALLVVHVGAGVVALIAALIALVSKKGSTRHRQIGVVFFWSMLTVGATAIPVTFYRPNPFLFFIALFSLYMAFAGYRRGKARFESTRLDRLVAISMIALAVVMIGYGVTLVLDGIGVGWALISFGGLGMAFGIVDTAHARKRQRHSAKVQVHLSRMIGGTIATITAVLVQQLSPLVHSELGQVALWLGPTVALVPLIVLWQIRIQQTGTYRLSANKP
jgi:uncharacterized membrane protein